MKHRCACIGCRVMIPQRLLACRTHWFMLPVGIRRKILNSYTKGQEKDISLIKQEYVAALKEAATYWKENTIYVG